VKSILIALVILSLAYDADATVRHTIGIARDAEDNSVRYVEHHQYSENGDHAVRYFDPARNVLLKKELAYTGLPQHPSILQRDYVRNMQIDLRYDAEQAVMVTSKDGGSEKFTFDITPDIIVDAGFDAYIRENWESFSKQPRQSVTFAIAGQSRLLAMNIERKGISIDGASFEVRPANWLAPVLLPEIQLNYDNDRQLVRYEGFTNLKAESGQSRAVVIEFSHYELERTLEEPLPQWVPEIAGE
jgi:hypothetical protein